MGTSEYFEQLQDGFQIRGKREFHHQRVTPEESIDGRSSPASDKMNSVGDGGFAPKPRGSKPGTWKKEGEERGKKEGRPGLRRFFYFE
jgi:hypothetical protein